MSLIFVFGSNTEGRHGKGAALHAKLYRGAIDGQAQGPQGNSYAIVTKELRDNHLAVTLDYIKKGVEIFLLYAATHPDDLFQVTALGTGLAGFKREQIAPMFRVRPDNVILPEEFIQILDNEEDNT